MIELNAERKLDIQKLTKGDYLSLDVLREVTGLDPRENVDLYRLAVLKIRRQIVGFSSSRLVARYYP